MGSSNPRNADDIFAEYFGASSPFGTKSPNSSSTTTRFSPRNADDIFQGFFSDGSGTSTSSMPKKKPPPLERKLPFSLEELYSGSSRKMKISRDVVKANGWFFPLYSSNVISLCLCVLGLFNKITRILARRTVEFVGIVGFVWLIFWKSLDFCLLCSRVANELSRADL